MCPWMGQICKLEILKRSTYSPFFCEVKRIYVFVGSQYWRCPWELMSHKDLTEPNNAPLYFVSNEGHKCMCIWFRSCVDGSGWWTGDLGHSLEKTCSSYIVDWGHLHGPWDLPFTFILGFTRHLAFTATLQPPLC